MGGARPAGARTRRGDGARRAHRGHRGGPMNLETVSTARSFGGIQGVYRHASRATGTEMAFSLYLPPQAVEGRPLPVVWYLSGLTCTHANVTEKGEYRRACA